MDADDAARLEHIRRWVRPDWERYVRPDWERYVHPAGHEAVRKEMELCRRAFETPRERAARKREEEAELERKHEEQAELERERAWEERCAAFKLRSDLAWDRFMRVLRQYLSQKAGFNPDQPRDEQGRWTDSGSGSDGTADDGSSGDISDLPPSFLDGLSEENLASTLAAESDRRARERVDLHEEEARGGHTISKLVNRSPEALKAQVLEAFDREPRAQDVRSGSFPSVGAADRLVNSTLDQNRAIVDQVANGTLPGAVVSARFGSVTGIEAVAPNARSQPYLRETYGVGVFIVHNRLSTRGYNVLTAFPSNPR
jgi:hypothetical protein